MQAIITKLTGSLKQKDIKVEKASYRVERDVQELERNINLNIMYFILIYI